MKYMKNKSIFFSFILIVYLISIKATNCINEDLVNSLSEKITEENLEKELSNIQEIIKEFDLYIKVYKYLIEREKMKKAANSFNETKFKKEYKTIYDIIKLYKDYFFKQRSRMSNYINMPKGNIEQKIYDVYHSTVEYSLEVQDMIKDIEEKINVNKEDL